MHKLAIAYKKSTCLTSSGHHQVAFFQTHVHTNVCIVCTYIWKTSLFDGWVQLKYIDVWKINCCWRWMLYFDNCDLHWWQVVQGYGF